MYLLRYYTIRKYSFHCNIPSLIIHSRLMPYLSDVTKTKLVNAYERPENSPLSLRVVVCSFYCQLCGQISLELAIFLANARCVRAVHSLRYLLQALRIISNVFGHSCKIGFFPGKVRYRFVFGCNVHLLKLLLCVFLVMPNLSLL